ncbi:MAG TPA: hypothetical protein VGM73_01570 [Candidatus Didemnitutus sp.]|jgi:hypothetical protein
MATHYPVARQARISSHGDPRLTRDTWGRFHFLPPELANPRVVFDPQPFRAQEFGSNRPSKAPYTR